MDFKELVEKFVTHTDEIMYSPLGDVCVSEDPKYSGHYWYYDTKEYLIDIQDFYFHEDYIVSSDDPEGYTMPFVRALSNFYFTADGEWIAPDYQKVQNNTVFVWYNCDQKQSYIMHKNSRMFMVGIKFKHEFFKRHAPDMDEKIDAIFWDTRELITVPIRKISEEILQCKMNGMAAEMFFDAKAKEWFSIILNAYEKIKKTPALRPSEGNAIEKVCRYIDDHYNINISQDILEKIAFVGGTKLKKDFKNHTGMTITEYTQRKRIDMADNLLRTTNMKIKDIAMSVGYSSPARFSTLYFRYRGKYPKDMRKTSCL